MCTVEFCARAIHMPALVNGRGHTGTCCIRTCLLLTKPRALLFPAGFSLHTPHRAQDCALQHTSVGNISCTRRSSPLPSALFMSAVLKMTATSREICRGSGYINISRVCYRSAERGPTSSEQTCSRHSLCAAMATAGLTAVLPLPPTFEQ